MEIDNEHATELMASFLRKYNSTSQQNFCFRGEMDDMNNKEYDLICTETAGTTLKIQVVYAPPAREQKVSMYNGTDFETLAETGRALWEKCGRGERNFTPIVQLSSDTERLREALSKKVEAYAESLRSQLILLIDFGILQWRKYDLPAMRLLAGEMNDGFQSIYCICTRKLLCERLA